jgi:hypothetical protein
VGFEVFETFELEFESESESSNSSITSTIALFFLEVPQCSGSVAQLLTLMKGMEQRIYLVLFVLAGRDVKNV